MVCASLGAVLHANSIDSIRASLACTSYAVDLYGSILLFDALRLLPVYVWRK